MLQESVHRLEEKLSNLEPEPQVLQQQAVSVAPNKRAESHIPIDAMKAAGLVRYAWPFVNHRVDYSQVDDRPQKSLNKKQQENQELLIRCGAQPLGFAGNRQTAACIIYKCLLHWRSFEVERTSVFVTIIQTIGHAIEM
ncbi:hypothetical protein Tsubulata_001920 [Turnera subulata]|uniref:Uncharacterized protein n=1 Tax=Turnera subulata TaxID=218843 RepID=A0A9Q0FK20_9ROSI|nr:hypothetical protein Tsubulata_001920 [Turnera subulata]